MTELWIYLAAENHLMLQIHYLLNVL